MGRGRKDDSNISSLLFEGINSGTEKEASNMFLRGCILHAYRALDTRSQTSKPVTPIVRFKGREYYLVGDYTAESYLI